MQSKTNTPSDAPFLSTTGFCALRVRQFVFGDLSCTGFSRFGTISTVPRHRIMCSCCSSCLLNPAGERCLSPRGVHRTSPFSSRFSLSSGSMQRFSSQHSNLCGIRNFCRHRRREQWLAHRRLDVLILTPQSSQSFTCVAVREVWPGSFSYT